MLSKTVSGRIFAIGDIHGCVDQLRAILKHIITVDKFSDEDHLVFVGDYMDRGPSSKGVLDTLVELKKQYSNITFLRGNHEDMFMGFLGMGGKYGEWYLSNGGFKVFEEYGLDHHVGNSPSIGGWIRSGLTASELRSLFPADHVEFISSTEQHITINDTLFFVHAGLNPNFKFENQTEEEFFWVREPFLTNPHSFGKTIIHGHTIAILPYFNLPYEINIDTGCFFSTKDGWHEDGALTCLKITDSKDLLSARFLQVKNGSTEVIDSTDGCINVTDKKVKKEESILTMRIVTSHSSKLFDEFQQLDGIVVPVNCLGIMGAGLALAVKKAFPKASERYMDICKCSIMEPGMVFRTVQDGHYFYFVATKKDWKNKSELNYVEKGIKSLVQALVGDDITSIAIPALGCGLGGLSWGVVCPILEQELQQLSSSNIKVVIYPPSK